MKQNFTRLLQSSIAFGSALLLTLIFHEFGHGITARLIYGLHPTVYGLHEDDIASSHTAIGVIASAGPIIGLVIGLIFLFIIHKRQTGQGFDRYLTLWLGVLGIVAFFGYLLTAPFYATGDVRVVLASLGLTSPLFSWIALALGVVGIIQTARIAMPYFVRLTNRDLPLRPQMMALGLFAWLTGGITVILLTIPAYPLFFLTNGFVAPLIGLFASRRNKKQTYGEPGANPTVSFVGIALLIILAVLEHTLLRNGVRL